MDAPSGLVDVESVLQWIREDKYMGLKEGAAYLSMSERTFRSHFEQMPRFKVGGKWLFKKSELDAWMERKRVRPEEVEGVVDSVLGKMGE